MCCGCVYLRRVSQNKKLIVFLLLPANVTFIPNSHISFISNSIGVASHITLEFLCGDELITIFLVSDSVLSPPGSEPHSSDLGRSPFHLVPSMCR